MFSTTTMASSTKIPIENISAKSEIRLRVKPHAHEANNVSAKVIIIATPTMADSRAPIVNSTNITTAAVAKINLNISVLAFSPAVAP